MAHPSLWVVASHYKKINDFHLFACDNHSYFYVKKMRKKEKESSIQGGGTIDGDFGQRCDSVVENFFIKIKRLFIKQKLYTFI